MKKSKDSLMLKYKKSSLESVNIIVIFVISMVVLGLTLHFTRTTFTGIHDNFFVVNEQLKEQINTYLFQNDVKLYFPATDVKIGKGEQRLLSVGITNKKDETLRYKITIKAGNDKNGNSFSADNWFQYIDKERAIPPSESHIGNIKLAIPKGAASGSYSLTLEITDMDEEQPEDVYASKDFFVVVTN